jgi:glutaminase
MLSAPPLLEDPVMISQVLREITILVKPLFGRGRVASYIPQLACVSPTKFGMSYRTISGLDCATGDCDEAFSIQSLSKVLSLILALNRMESVVWSKMGKEPSGTPFNLIAQLEAEKGIPRNPLINAGALVVTDLLFEAADDPARLVLDFTRFLVANDGLQIDEAVAASELKTAFTNMALANVLRLHGTVLRPPATIVESYSRQCGIAITCRELTRAFMPLAARGMSPFAAEVIVPERLARRLNALLFTCGMYDSVGSFAYRVGLPAKSGVGGGTVAIIPNVGTLCVWSPELDRFGNSVLATAALEHFVQLTGCSIL